jgi:hypothetical protein
MGDGWIPAAWRSAMIFLRALWKAARELFHEAAGTFFAVFAFSGVIAIWRQWNQLRIPWLLAATAAYTLMMLYFSITSFLNARRVR